MVILLIKKNAYTTKLSIIIFHSDTFEQVMFTQQDNMPIQLRNFTTILSFTMSCLYNIMSIHNTMLQFEIILKT